MLDRMRTTGAWRNPLSKANRASAIEVGTAAAAGTDPWLDAFRGRCDPLADDVVAAIERDPSLPRRLDLLAACTNMAAAGDPSCGAFLDATSTVPEWVRFEEHALGRDMFLRYGVLTLMIGFTVLVDTYAGAKDNKVLMMSGRLGGRSSFRRLIETARFTDRVIEEGGLRPGAEGHRAVLSVRLLHARVRAYCRRAGYDVTTYDEPINQEALCGTLMLFSAGVIIALEKFGIEVSAAEKESYHRLWCYVGYLMGIEGELLPATYAGERALYDRIKRHQYHPDGDSIALFESAVEGVANGARDLPLWLKLLGAGMMQSQEFLRQFTAFCVDPRLASHLVGSSPLHWRAGFGAATAAFWAASRIERRLPIVRDGVQWGQAALFRQVIRTMLREEDARFEDPGFDRGEAVPTR